MTAPLTYPKLRPIEVHPATHQGQPAILLQDPLQLSGQSFVVHQPLATVLALLDGEHTLHDIEISLKLLTGIELAAGTLKELIESLDNAILLESNRFQDALAAALESYRQAESRPALLAGQSYPEDMDELRAWLDSFIPEPIQSEIGTPLGLIVPHLDYERGGQVYANVFSAGRRAITQADLIVIFGTDHHGPSIAPTLTRQNYTTPLGQAITAQTVIDGLQDAAADVDLFEHELYHAGEHSIELALIWVQHILEGKQVEFLPILAGSVHEFLEGLTESADSPQNQALAQTFSEIIAGRNVALIASGDLGHIGPAFGGLPVDDAGAERLLEADMEKIDRLCEVDPQGFLDLIRREQNQDSICGSAPIHRLLTWTTFKRGHLVGYTQCDADPDGTSIVSACGIVYEK